MRTRREIVTFYRAFVLKGVDGRQPAGEYAVVTREEEIHGLHHTAWHRVETSLRLPSVDTVTLQEQYISINPTDLAAALARDTEVISHAKPCGICS